MRRRDFLAASGAAGCLPLMSLAEESRTAGEPLWLELRVYHLDSQQQRDGLEAFARDAAIPALNRLGIAPVGVFHPIEELSPVYVLLPHPTPQSAMTAGRRLSEDAEFVRRGKAYLDATAAEPAYRRLETSLLRAFRGMPQVERPVESPGRIFQLRIYESPSELTGQKKIEMFNDAGEIEIFRRVGLHPVFFGETVIGAKMPNLTYMLAFETTEQMQQNWQKFLQDPDWQRLKTMDEYANERILSNITNLVLKPADGSQI